MLLIFAVVDPDVDVDVVMFDVGSCDKSELEERGGREEEKGT